MRFAGPAARRPAGSTRALSGQMIENAGDKLLDMEPRDWLDYDL